MGSESPARSNRWTCRAYLLLTALACVSLTGLPRMAAAQGTITQATAVPLLLPNGLIFDVAGDLIFAESGNHAVRMVAPSGSLTTVAGTGVQGFAGDGGLAVAAELDSPAAVTLDTQGNLFIADTRNHRIRRVDGLTHVITTVAGTGTPGSSPDGTAAVSAQLDLPVALAFDAAGDLFFADARQHLVRRVDAQSGQIRTLAGSGLQGFSGDDAPATAAALDSPYGLAVDAAGDVFIADTHNQRVRRVDAVTGKIATVAGTGIPTFAGDAGPAMQAGLALPRGLALDAAGNLFLVDSANQRIRRVDAVTGQIGSIAGSGTQGYGGDGAPATAALLNAPRAVGISPGGLATLADSANGRLRQVDATGVIHTYAGLGALSGASLALSGPSVVRYGAGALTATLTASPATGSVTLLDETGAGAELLETAVLTGNAAGFSTALLAAGAYRLEATYGGDATHASAQSTVLSLTIQPAPVLASPNAISLLYGQPAPALSGTLTGVLPQDTSMVSLGLHSGAAVLSPPGSYPITASLTGPAAGNYALTQTPAAVSIAQASALVTLGQTPGTVAAHVVSTTAGAPTGIVTLLDGAHASASTTLSAAGDATFPTSGLTTGTHLVTAAYQGDTNFLPASSAPLLVTSAPSLAVDFSLSATGQTSVTVPAGAAAEFGFTVMPLHGALSSPIELAASGLPVGAIASFSPAYLPPSGSPSAFVLTIQTPQARLTSLPGPVWAMLLPGGLLLLSRRRRRAAGLALLLFATGCGARTFTRPAASSGISYNVVVTATGSGASGAVLVHTATVVMSVD